MMKKLILAVITLFACYHSFAGNEKYRLILVNDPATTITIGWNQTSGTDVLVYYDTVDHGTDYLMYAFTKNVDRIVEYRGMNNHFARLTGLTPDKAYYFVIHDSEGTSDRYWFKTAPDDLSRLSIIAGGDSRTNRAPRQRANLLVSKLKPHAVLFGGDMTDDDTNIQWQNWMDDWQNTIAANGRMFPIIPAQGNHESHEVVYNLFDTPTDSYYYATTFGDNLFRTYTLNTEMSVSGNQLLWLQEDLAQNGDVIWKAAQYHKPMRPHYSGKPENDAAYDAWAQLFFEHGVRLVVECDAHNVKTTWPIQPWQWEGNDEGFIINETYGTVYVGEGGWGAPLYDNDDDKSWTRNSGLFYQFKLIFIDPSKIELRTIKTDNAEEVGEVSDDDPFTLPDNLDVWDPSNGAVVEIMSAPSMNFPDVEFAAGTPVVYQSGENIALTLDVLDEGNGINQVKFYIDNVLAETLNTPPFTLTHSYDDGNYSILAVATDELGLIDEETINISIGVFTKNEEILVKNGQDDVEETEAGLVYFNSSDLEMVFDDYDFDPGVPNGFQKIGLRFQKVFIPAGAVIDSAFIQFRSDETDNAFAEFLIYAENTDNALPFDDGDVLSVSARNTFPDSVYWAPPPWTETGVVGPAQKTTDISSLLQQVIDRDDWVPGNSIVFKIVGTGVSLEDENAIRVADSYEGKPTYPPTLVYAYSFDATQVGVKLYKDESMFLVYPNPFDHYLNLVIPNAKDQSITVIFKDVMGRAVFTKETRLVNDRLTINPEIQNRGVYIMEVQNGFGDVLLQQKVIRY